MLSLPPGRSALLLMDLMPIVVPAFGGDLAMLKRLSGAAEAARRSGIDVVHVRVRFRAGYPEVAGTNKIFGIVTANYDFTESNPDTGIHPAIITDDSDIHIIKRRVSAFAGSDLDLVLRARGVHHLVLGGVTTSGVVLSTLRQAADLDYRLTVLADGCADGDPLVQRVLLENVFPAHADVLTVDDWVATAVTDEFRWLTDIADGLPGSPTVPPVRRIDEMVDGRRVSGLRWGNRPPEVVLLHGGGQNAHTWDTTMLALGRPAIAIDLPGHGHSAWRADVDYTAAANAAAIEGYLHLAALRPAVIVGMSLGGLTAIHLAVSCPSDVAHLVVVDVTPQSGLRVAAMSRSERGGTALLADPGAYPDFEDLVAVARAAMPTRDAESLRRGVWHNAVRGDDGLWRWRADRRRSTADRQLTEHLSLWPLVDRLVIPTTLVLATRSGVVTPEDAAEFVRRAKQAAVVRIDTDVHSVQSARPVELAEIVRARLP